MVCIDDQPEVLNALEQDLEELEDYFTIETCDNGEEALKLMEELDDKEYYPGVVISDQVMPAMSGVELLRTIREDGRFDRTQKILLTGQATHDDTIEAINHGGLDFYIRKPWDKTALIDTVKKAMTRFILVSGLEYTPYLPVLDQSLLYELLHKNG